METWTLFYLVLRSCLVTNGGLQNVPILHDDFLSRGMTDERQFAESLTIGQTTPGPNGLWVVCLGYLMQGWRGAAATLAAICIPPFVVLLSERLYRRVQHHPAVDGFVRGMALAGTSVFAVVLWRIFPAGGNILRPLLIAALAFGLMQSQRVPVVLIVALAALAGIVWR